MTSRSKALRAEENRSTPVAAAFDARALLASLPGLPGVYRMIGGGGGALYVGKAGELKNRVSSYFLKMLHGPLTAMMLTHVPAVRISRTPSLERAFVTSYNIYTS